jgi:hypothetical protein
VENPQSNHNDKPSARGGFAPRERGRGRGPPKLTNHNPRDRYFYCQYHGRGHSTEGCLETKKNIARIQQEKAMMSIASAMPNQLRPSFWQPQFMNSQPNLGAIQQFQQPQPSWQPSQQFYPQSQAIQSIQQPQPIREILPPPPDNPSKPKSSSRTQNSKALPSFGTIMPITGGSAMEFETKRQRSNYFRSVKTIINDGPAARPEWAKVLITFIEEDFRLKSTNHNDAMVIEVNIAGWVIGKILVDNGSSADILFLKTFEKMNLSQHMLHPLEYPLHGFGGKPIKPVGKVSLLVSFGDLDNARTETLTFDVVDIYHPYLAIFGRGFMNKFDVVIRQQFLCMKTPAPKGVITVFGDQQEARNIEKGHTPGQTNVYQLNSLEEERKPYIEAKRDKEKIEIAANGETKKVYLDDMPDRAVMIGAHLTPEDENELIKFLNKNKDVFAWSAKDRQGVDRDIIEHTLETDEKIPPNKQRHFKGYSVQHIPRDDNNEADKLAKAVARNQEMPPDVFFKIIKELPIKEIKSKIMNVVETLDWRVEIMAYLRGHYEPQDELEEKRLK